MASLLVTATNTQVFVDQPNPGPVFVPVQSQLQLTCSVVEGYAAVWRVDLPDREPLETDRPIVLNPLRQRNITVTTSEDNKISTLSLNIHQEESKPNNNGSVLSCYAVNSINASRTDGNEVLVTFYGPPPPPTALTSTENVLGSLNVSWSLEFIEGVPVNYTLTAINLNASSADPIRISGIKSQYYVFTVEESKICDIYSFRVEAVTVAAVSGQSEALNTSISVLPDISLIEDSLNYTLFKTTDADSVTLTITLQNEVRCLEYPTLSYTLIAVESSSGNVTAITSDVDPSSNSTEISIELLENLKYSFSVTATNQFGNSSESTTVDIKTTDVQNISIECIEGTNYSIQCIYLVGSDARGCRYSFANEVNGSIDINSSAGDTVQLTNILRYNEVVAYDWESDDTFSDITTRVDIPSNIACPSITATSTATITTSGTANDETACFTPIILASVLTTISTALLATVIFVLVQIALCKCCPKATPGEAESVPSAEENGQTML